MDAPLLHTSFTADPSARVFDGALYVIMSHDTDERMQWPGVDEGQFQMVDYRLLRAARPNAPIEDLGAVLPLADVPWARQQLWAPDLIRGADGRYHLIFCAKDANGIFRIGAAHADAPEGPYTADAVPLNGTMSIDPSVMIASGGVTYLYFGGLLGGQLERWRQEPSDGKARGPLVVTLNPSMSATEGSVREVVILDGENGRPLQAADESRRFFEGVQVYERRGIFYMLYSTGTTHRIVYATASSPLGPFTYRGALLAEVWGWTTHGSAVDWLGQTYYLHHDSSCSLGETARRCVKVARMRYADDDSGEILPMVKGWAPAPSQASSPPPSAGSTVGANVIGNGATRLDESGRPLNAHQGSMVFDEASGRFFLYGNYQRACVAAIHCWCVGHEEGWTVTSGVAIYSAGSLAGPWRREAGPVLPPFNQPRVIGPVANSTRPWRMYLQFPLRLATSTSPAGPFALRPDVVGLDHDAQDMGVFLDADGRTSYMIYTTPPDYRIRVQRLSDDGQAGVRGAVSEPFGPQPCEAPVLFRYSPSNYFALFGHNCWCCVEGAEAYAFRAPSPLGPWTALGDINLRSDGGARAVPGQTAFIVQIPSPIAQSPASTSFVLAFDEWMTGNTRAEQFQYWVPLEFDEDGEEHGAVGAAFTIRPLLAYRHSWLLTKLREQTPTPLALPLRLSPAPQPPPAALNSSKSWSTHAFWAVVVVVCVLVARMLVRCRQWLRRVVPTSGNAEPWQLPAAVERSDTAALFHEAETF